LDDKRRFTVYFCIDKVKIKKEQLIDLRISINYKKYIRKNKIKSLDRESS